VQSVLKIAQIVNSIDPRRGGKERYVGDLVRELVNLGHEVTLITCDKKFKININCEIRYVRKITIPSGLEIPSLKDLIEQLDSRLDICHLHYHAVFGEIIAFVCHLHGLPLITTFHDEMKRGTHKIIYDRLLLGMMSNFSNKIICLTPGMKNVLVRRGLRAGKVVVKPNAMYVNEFQYRASNIKTIRTDESDLLFVGRLEERKGVHFLLKALSLLKDRDIKPMLIIVGEGIYKSKLISLSKAYGLSSQVVFTGYIPRDLLMKAYLSTKFVVIPSLYEGTPAVALEALALGKPIITTLIAGMEEINSKKFGPSVPPKDSNSLADAIENALLFSGEELARINSDAKEFIINYDWNSVVKNILSLYEESVLNA